nr:Hpt domain-containing protein [Parahaliea mediterranea]
MIAFAEQRAAELDRHIDDLSAGSAVVVAEAEAVAPAGAAEATAAPEGGYVEDRDIPPEFREVFLEESEEIVAELTRLMSAWELDPEVGHELKEIRRHFHTFKGNGRAVGANVLGELGWSAQDMLDRVLDGEIPPDDKLQALLKDVVTALPGLVASFQDPGGFDVSTTRELTNRCFRMAETGADDLASDMPQMDGAATPSGPSAPEHSALHS